MGGLKRTEMLSNYITAIEHGRIISPVIETMRAEHLYAATNDVWGTGHLPDTISAGANAYSLVGGEAEEGDSGQEEYRG